MYTYIICLDGRYHAVGMDFFGNTVTDPETSATRSGIRTVEDRNRAIRDVTRPVTWREALNIATRSGKYIGQLYAGERHIMEEV